MLVKDVNFLKFVQVTNGIYENKILFTYLFIFKILSGERFATFKKNFRVAGSKIHQNKLQNCR